jgi:anti-sigma regulatory factor (Ser/Thr protein kinase)
LIKSALAREPVRQRRLDQPVLRGDQRKLVGGGGFKRLDEALLWVMHVAPDSGDVVGRGNHSRLPVGRPALADDGVMLGMAYLGAAPLASWSRGHCSPTTAWPERPDAVAESLHPTARIHSLEPAVGASRQTVSLPASPRSPSLARGLVTETLSGASVDVIDTATLLTSELVANAVRHADSPVVLTVTESCTRVVVTVEDCSPEPPKPEIPALEAETGRGLPLVHALATSWGWDRCFPGKVVWFALDPAAAAGVRP